MKTLFMNEKSIMTESRWMVTWGYGEGFRGSWEGSHEKGHKETFGDDIYVYSLDCGYDTIGWCAHVKLMTYTSQTSNCRYQTCSF